MNEKIMLINTEDYEDLVKCALKEDLGAYGDITSKYIFDENAISGGYIICKEKEDCILAGIDIAQYIFKLLDPGTSFEFLKHDGEKIRNKEKICFFKGKTTALLKAERTSLNFISHLSGIATLTSKFVEIASEYGVRITETRKTLPNLRLLEKYAVRCGGGINHRFGLFDGILIKDNHIAACGSLAEAVKRTRSLAPHTLKIEVEVKTREDLEQAISSRADVIMLDNLDNRDLQEAVKKIRDSLGNHCTIEASGGVRLDTLQDICKTGVDIVSIGALTNSAKAIDFSLDFN